MERENKSNCTCTKLRMKLLPTIDTLAFVTISSKY